MEDMWGKIEIGVVKVKFHMLPVRGLGSREFSRFTIYFRVPHQQKYILHLMH